MKFSQFANSKIKNQAINIRSKKHSNIKYKRTNTAIQALNKKKNIFDLEVDQTDIMLTHNGKPLEEQYSQSISESEEVQEVGYTNHNRDKSNKEVYREIISKSKQFAYDRKKQKEENKNLLLKVNESNNEIINLLQKRSGKVEPVVDEYSTIAQAINEGERVYPNKKSVSDQTARIDSYVSSEEESTSSEVNEEVNLKKSYKYENEIKKIDNLRQIQEKFTKKVRKG